MKLNYIDSLRGIAILSVIWFHCHLHHYSNPAYFSFMDTMGTPASMGVQLFYVLSAFTLFLSQNRRSGVIYQTFNFFLRRFFRIAPMYYVAIIYYLYQISYTYNQSLLSTIGSNEFSILSNISLTHGLSPTWINSIVPGGWSVGIEVLFYAMIPFLSARVTKLDHAIVFTSYALIVGFALTAVLMQIQFIQSSQAFKEYIFYYIPYQLPAFGCGIVAYFLIIKRDNCVSRSSIILAFISIGLIIISKFFGRLLSIDLPHTIYLFGGIGFIGLLIFLSRYQAFLLVNKLTRFMGKISYSAYLTHFGVLYWLDKNLPQDIISVNSVMTNVLNFQLKFFVAVLLTTIISTFTYRVIEEPGQRFGNRFIKRSPKPVSILE